MNDKVMNAEQAAVFLGVSEASVRIWTRDGVLDCLRYGRTVRYTREQLLTPRNADRDRAGTPRAVSIRAALKAAAA
jgi:excisionase family DNA binding protein